MLADGSLQPMVTTNTAIMLFNGSWRSHVQTSLLLTSTADTSEQQGRHVCALLPLTTLATVRRTGQGTRLQLYYI